MKHLHEWVTDSKAALVQWNTGETVVSGGVFRVLGWLVNSSLWLSDRKAGPELLKTTERVLREYPDYYVSIN